MAAKYPSQAYVANLQSTGNDKGTLEAADGADYNLHDEEIKAISDDLRAAAAEVSGASDMQDAVSTLNSRTQAIRCTVGINPPGTQTIPTGADTLITHDTEYEDTDTMFSAPSTTVTCNTAGYYLINAWIRWSPNGSAGKRTANILLNGSLYQTFSLPGDTTEDTDTPVVIGVALAATNTIQLQVNQSSGSDCDVAGATLQVIRLGDA